MSFQRLKSFSWGLFLAGLVTAIVTGIGFPALAEGDSAKIRASCHSLLGAMTYAVMKTPATDNSPAKYRERLLAVLNSSPAKEFDRLFRDFDAAAFGDLYWFARINSSRSTVNDDLDRHPEQRQFVLDINEFNRDFPGALWDTDQPSLVMRKKLEKMSPASDETRVKNARADQLHQRISSLATTLLNRSISEYQGLSLDRSFGQRFKDAIKRFVFPHYKRVSTLVKHGRIQQNQLGLIAAIDGIISNRGLSRVDSLHFTDSEMGNLRVFENDTPMQIAEVYEELKSIYGSEALSGAPLREQTVDIYALYGKVKNRDLEAELADDQREAEKALDVLEQEINKARERSKLGARPLADYVKDELQIRHDEKNRKSQELLKAYRDITDEDSQVSYTVEDRHTRQVADGTDDKGQTKYRTEVYYLSRSVTPSYEEILTESFDRGDRGVYGLSSIIEATSTMRAREKTFRQALFTAREARTELIEAYPTNVANESQQKEFYEKLSGALADLNRARKDLTPYSRWSAREVANQWGDDLHDNFNRRNTSLLMAIENEIRAVVFTKEILNRKLETLNFSVGYTDLDKALKILRTKMMINYGIKISSTTLIGGAGGFAYFYPTEAQIALNWFNSMTEQLMTLIPF